MEIFLIDGIGPFFRAYQKRRINWSKIPFHHLNKQKSKLDNVFLQIAKDMEIFAEKVQLEGYNSISLDDVSHLANDFLLDREVNELVDIYRREYKKIFTICRSKNLDIYLTMDVLSLTSELRERLKGDRDESIAFFKRQIINILTSFPEIRGIILRIGESDGHDVKGVFRSELILQTPKDLNLVLKELLPIFEEHDKYLILRTWTVGAYPVGDFSWHRRTSARALKGIDSPNFILSMKYGESDFFRYLPLNTLFFTLKVKKIIELQAKREYEGCGEYPSFIGWDYHNYAKQLANAPNMVGMSVWCQTGGWIPFRRLSYLESPAIWNELNSHVSIRIFKGRASVEEAIASFAARKNISNVDKFTELLKLSDEVIKELLYIPEVARKKRFFRRVRIPPLLTVMWNNIFINDSVRTALRAIVSSGENCIESGERSLEKIEQMKLLAEELDLSTDDFDFMYDTFFILNLAREYYFTPYNEEIRQTIKSAKRAYKKKYPKSLRPRYRIKTNYSPFLFKRRHLRFMLRITLRKKRRYRLLDHLITLHLLGFAYRFLVKIRPKSIPKFARKQAMGIETIFK